MRTKWRYRYYGNGDARWTLYRGKRALGGVIRYHWGGTCLGYITLPLGDRDVCRKPTPGPTRQCVARVARSLR